MTVRLHSLIYLIKIENQHTHTHAQKHNSFGTSFISSSQCLGKTFRSLFTKVSKVKHRSWILFSNNALPKKVAQPTNLGTRDDFTQIIVVHGRRARRVFLIRMMGGWSFRKSIISSVNSKFRNFGEGWVGVLGLNFRGGIRAILLPYAPLWLKSMRGNWEL